MDLKVYYYESLYESRSVKRGSLEFPHFTKEVVAKIMQTCSSIKSSKLQLNGNVKLGLVKFFILYHKHKESLDFGVKVAVVPDLLFNLFGHLWAQEV